MQSNTNINLSRSKFLEIYDAIQYRRRYISPFHFDHFAGSTQQTVVQLAKLRLLDFIGTNLPTSEAASTQAAYHMYTTLTYEYNAVASRINNSVNCIAGAFQAGRHMGPTPYFNL